MYEGRNLFFHAYPGFDNAKRKKNPKNIPIKKIEHCLEERKKNYF